MVKSSNKNRLKKMEKSFPVPSHISRKIIYDPNFPLPAMKEPGPFIFLPENGHRFPKQNTDN